MKAAPPAGVTRRQPYPHALTGWKRYYRSVFRSHMICINMLHAPLDHDHPLAIRAHAQHGKHRLGLGLTLPTVKRPFVKQSRV
jgi:hypothetical protein